MDHLLTNGHINNVHNYYCDDNCTESNMSDIDDSNQQLAFQESNSDSLCDNGGDDIDDDGVVDSNDNAMSDSVYSEHILDLLQLPLQYTW